MRKVFLDNLPTTRKGKYIDWINSIGYKVKFIYDDIKGEMEIVDYDKSKYKLIVKYNNNDFSIQVHSLINCQLLIIVGKYIKEYRYNIGDIIEIKNTNLQILEHIRIKYSGINRKGYIYKCLKCNQINKALETNLIQNIGCPICCNSPQKVIKGINDMWTTNSELAKLLLNPEDGYRYTQNSHKRVNWKCPNCEEIIKNKTINKIKIRGLSCLKCSDGRSYAEKFMYSFLLQLNIEFKSEYSPSWIKPRRYDFYIPSINCIIETHGLQHYKEGFNKCIKKARTLQEEQENDKLKQELAINNNIKYYIVLDCSESNLEYIKNSILNSKLNELFDLSQIDWEKCANNYNSIIFEICNLWNNGTKGIKLISEIIGLNKNSVLHYLKKGASINLCNYEPKRRGMNNKIICLTTKEIFESGMDAVRKYNINNGNLYQCCKEKHKYSGKHPETGEKLKWMYYDEYLKLKGSDKFDSAI